MEIIFKLIKKFLTLQDVYFNRNIIGRTKTDNKLKKKNFSINKNQYWNVISKRILDASNHNDGKNFFQDRDVILHLASENINLGYKLVNKIRSHPHGEGLLNKCTTPSWGSPFLLKKYPFASPTTLSHLANLLSIYDSFGQELKLYKSFVDFGGGYGGLARCLHQISKKINISIVDLITMQHVQKKYLNHTLDLDDRINFFKNINELNDNYEIFNASFSFSEISLEKRRDVENFVIEKCSKLHIIFQSNFNDIDNKKYMNDFSIRLKGEGWQVSIKPYDWYGWDSTSVMTAKSSDSPN